MGGVDNPPSIETEPSGVWNSPPLSHCVSRSELELQYLDVWQLAVCCIYFTDVDFTDSCRRGTGKLCCFFS